MRLSTWILIACLLSIGSAKAADVEGIKLVDKAAGEIGRYIVIRTLQREGDPYFLRQAQCEAFIPSVYNSCKAAAEYVTKSPRPIFVLNAMRDVTYFFRSIEGYCADSKVFVGKVYDSEGSFTGRLVEKYTDEDFFNAAKAMQSRLKTVRDNI